MTIKFYNSWNLRVVKYCQIEQKLEKIHECIKLVCVISILKGRGGTLGIKSTSVLAESRDVQNVSKPHDTKADEQGMFVSYITSLLIL
jgi:hypothetical protein